MKKAFTYSTQHYFPNHIKLIGLGFFAGGLIAFTSANHMVSLILLFVGAFILTTKYGIRIDLDNRSYLDHLSILGFKKGRIQKFDEIESIYITSGKKTTKMQLRGHASTITEEEFNGYIKFSDDEKIHLLSSTKKEDVEKLLTQMSKDLNIKLEDFSSEN